MRMKRHWQPLDLNLIGLERELRTISGSKQAVRDLRLRREPLDWEALELVQTKGF